MLRGLSLRGLHPWRAGRVWQSSTVPTVGSGFPLKYLRQSLSISVNLRSRGRLGFARALPPANTPGTIHPIQIVRGNHGLALGRSGRVSMPRGLVEASLVTILRPMVQIVRTPQQLIRAGRTWVPNPPPVVPSNIDNPQLTIREAVIARLNALTPLTAIVGPRIYWEDASEIAVYPCVICAVTSRDWGHHLPGADGTSLATFTLDALARDEATSKAIADIIRQSFDGFCGFQSGIYFLRTFIVDENDSAFQPADGSDKWTFQVSTTYEIKHRVPFPTTVTQTDV